MFQEWLIFFQSAFITLWFKTKLQEISETCKCFDTAILSLAIYPKEMIKDVHKVLWLWCSLKYCLL